MSCANASPTRALKACLRSAAAPPAVNTLVFGSKFLRDLFDFDAIGTDLHGYDACFFCLGVTSAGISEADYTHLTFDLTLGWARVLAGINPRMTFVYVSGSGTGGKSMWAQVKGRTEDALLELFPSAYARCTARFRKRAGRGSATPSFGRYCRSCGRSLRGR